ncbi:MAG: hypothetical protein ACYC2T_09455 [Bacillota bacterium]
MPRCLHCGNSSYFGGSSFPPALTGMAGVTGAFGSDGGLTHVENSTASPEVLQDAWRKPEHHFDTCSRCGSRDVLWP